MGSFVSNCYLNIVILKICLKFKMNQLFVLSALVCVLAVPVLSTIELAIGGLTLTAAQTTLLGAGLLGAKLLGVGVGAGLASKGRSRSRSYSRGSYRKSYSRGRSYGRKRYGRDVSDNEVNEPEFLFQSFEVSDPAHCFRRYICDLATGQLNGKPGHQVINNLFLTADYSKSATFEYEVAFKFGQKLRSIQECEATYDCPLTGQQLDKLFE